MCRASRQYKNVVLLLYVEKTKRWYEIDKKTAEIKDGSVPVPSDILIDELSAPLTVPTINRYGRLYHSKFSLEIAKGLLRLLEMFISVVFGRRKRRK